MIEIRLVQLDDCQGMLEIYGPIIQNTATSFEYEVPEISEFQSRVLKIQDRYPWLICLWDGALAGYAYAGAHRERAAYQWSVEQSVYIHPKFYRLGIARSLYKALMSVLKLQGFYTALSGITLPNEVSVAFHESMGFSPIGIYRNIGFKFDQWHSVGWWEYQLQPYSKQPATPVFLDQISSSREFNEILQSAVKELGYKK